MEKKAASSSKYFSGLYRQLLDLSVLEYELFSSARLVGTSAKEIRQQLGQWGFKVRKTDAGEILIPKEGVIKLIKVIDSDACWECYNQLWADAHELDRLRPELAKKDNLIAELQGKLAELTS